MKPCRIFALAVAALILAAPAMAGDYKFSKSEGDERFALTLPEGWVLSDTLVTEMFFSMKSNIDFGADASLIHAGTPLNDPRVVKHIDLGKGPTVTSDRMLQQGGFPARRIDGTAVSEGEKLSFSSIAIGPATHTEIFQLTIWGPTKLWANPDIKRQVETMLASFKPLS